MNILFLSSWFPYPPDNGSKIRVYNLIRQLSPQHGLTLISFIPSMAEKAYVPYLKPYCEDVAVVEARPFRPREGKALLGFFSPIPRSLISIYNQEMETLVKRKVAENGFDLVIASTVPMAGYALRVQGIPRILEDHNFMTLWMEEQYRAQTHWGKRFRYWLTWQKSRRFERKTIRQFEACVMVSQRDAEGVRRLLPGYGPVEVIPNGVDLEHYAFSATRPEANTLIFNGALTYSANYDAMQYFLTEIYPLIKQRLPEVSLRITGCTEGVAVKQLAIDDSVTLTGYVDDIRPLVAGSTACVVPLRTGGGTRLKILEAMALGTPVVATSKGAEGLDVQHGEHLLIADEPQAFAEQAVHLLQDTGLRAQLAASARKLVETKYDWQAIGRKLDAFLRMLVERAPHD